MSWLHMQRNLDICLWETSNFTCELRSFVQISENRKFGGMAFVLNLVLWKCNFYSMCVSTEKFNCDETNADTVV